MPSRALSATLGERLSEAERGALAQLRNTDAGPQRVEPADAPAPETAEPGTGRPNLGGLPRHVAVEVRTDCRLALKGVRSALVRLHRSLASYPADKLPAIADGARALTAAIDAALPKSREQEE